MTESKRRVVLESHMTESKKLIALRDKLVFQRRAIVHGCQSAIVDLLNGDDITRIQEAIDAVDRALADEMLIESKGRI